MATVTYSATDEIMQDIAASIPGPQEGESIFDYRARVNGRLMAIVEAVGDHKKRVDGFVRDRSDPKLEQTNQFPRLAPRWATGGRRSPIRRERGSRGSSAARGRATRPSRSSGSPNGARP